MIALALVAPGRRAADDVDACRVGQELRGVLADIGHDDHSALATRFRKKTFDAAMYLG